MEKFNTDGIVIQTKVTGEADLIVFVLTRQRGIIRAFAKGARGAKSKLHGGSSLFAYSDFSFYEKNGVYHVTEAQVKEVFFSLRSDMARLSLAQYFSEVMLKTVTEETEETEYLRLMLGALFYLCEGKKDILLIKSVFELRMTVISGYAPLIHACAECGAFSTPQMYFHCLTGSVYCENCGKDRDAPMVTLSVISAMRHIVYSPFETVFSFSLSEASLLALNRLTEKYIQNCFGQRFHVLDYFRMATD